MARIPDADGATSFQISEPGFNSSLGYAQVETIGAILTGSVRQLDEDAKLMGHAIDSLQQLLVSLPRPEAVRPVAASRAIVPGIVKPRKK